MAKFEVLILPIDKVEDHPNAERLSLNHIRGFVAISNKNEDGSHRYRVGQLVAYVPEGAIVPISLLKARGYWDEKKDKGFLTGEKGNIVKAINLRGIVSRGLIFPSKEEGWFLTGEEFEGEPLYRSDLAEAEDITLADVVHSFIQSGEGHLRHVREGDDVTDFLNITKHEIHYPTPGMVSVINPGMPTRYEIEDLKKFPHLLDGQQVIITELLHGILCVIGYDRRLIDPFFVSSGSLAEHGLIFGKDNDNIYTRTAKPIWEDIKRYLKEMPAVEQFYIFGEIIGPGIQDIIYGLEETEYRAFDIQMGLMGAGRDTIPFGFVGVMKYQLLKWLNIATAPILWGGAFDRDIINQLADGPASIGGGLRKGVVITAEDENFIEGKRPILKNISDKYLLRAKGTEYK